MNAAFLAGLDGNNTQQAQGSQHGNGRVVSSEPHCLHLLVADDGLTEHYRYRVHLALCCAVLPVSELPGAVCSAGCESEVVYCVECLHTAVERNADAGTVWSPPGTRLLIGSSAGSEVGW